MNMKIYGKAGESGSAFGRESVMLEMGYIQMQSECPSPDHVAREDGTWEVTAEKFEELYQSDLATLDPILSHIYRHDFNGEVLRKARAEREFKIAQAKIMEKYGKGSTVYVTESGTCYHLDINCSALNKHEYKEICLSDGIENYAPCSVCAGNE